MDPAIEAFEALARVRVSLGPRYVAAYQGLVHPVHRSGRVFGWELGQPNSAHAGTRHGAGRHPPEVTVRE